jgi:ATP-dependent RNA helicase RhlE
MPFSKLGLSAPLLKAAARQGYKQAYPIQLKAIPPILSGNDILGIAQTGTGKTAGFVLPILEMLIGSAPSKNRHIKALVLVPTRELAIQVLEVFEQLGADLPQRIKMRAVYGGVSVNPQMIEMQGTQILVATPGRLLDLVVSNSVHLSEIQILVLDEADKMLNLGFQKEMEHIFSLLPKKRQNLLFSATLGKDLSAIQKNLLSNPVKILIEDQPENIELIRQVAYLVSEERKGPLLRYLIKHNNMMQVLVFTSSVFKADSVVIKLQHNGIEAKAIHSKKSQGARTEALRRFKAGQLRVLVATDMISRGIDIKFLPQVINYELPRSPKDYIHRIGRTGRAENPGEAISMINPEEEHHFKITQKKMGRPVTLIDSKDINLKGF